MLKSNHGSAIYSQKTSKVHQQYNRTIDMLGTTTNNILTICIYIPPNRPWYTIKDPLKELLEHTNKLAKENSCKTTIITGDFNHDLHNPSEQITELFKSYNFIQLITKPTHILGGILDLIFTNNHSTTASIYPNYFSDHHFIITQIPT